MDELADVGHSLPAYALGPLLLIAAMLTVLLARRAPSAAARYVMVAIFLRVALTAAHELTFARSPAGLSYNALATIAIAGAGLFIIRRRSLVEGGLPPLLFYLAILVTSGVVTAHVTPMANTFTKYFYLIILMLTTKEAIDDLGLPRFLRMLLPVFSIPFVLQAVSLILGVAKSSESDGSASYIGGFYHEAAFSVTLGAAILVVCLLRGPSLAAKLGMILVCTVGVFLANYRTVIVATLPLIGVTLLLETPRHFMARHRPIVFGIMAVTIAILAVGGGILASDRFGDLAVAAREGSSLIKRPEQFSVEDRHLMSGRPAIWSNYIYGWVDADPVHKMIGFGPNSWYDRFTLYAHNTLISALYEIGVLGVIATLLVWGWMLALALLMRGGPKAELVTAHLCFFVLNMATMPMWQIEGMIFYGLLCGTTLHFYYRMRHARAARPIQRVVPASRRPINT